MNAMDFDDLLVRDGQRPRAVPGGPRPLPERVPPRPRRRVPGHQPRPVPAAAAARGRAPEPGGRRRRCAVPGRRDAGDDGGRLDEADRAHRGRRRGAVLLRQRRLPPRPCDRDVRQPRVDGRRDHDAQRPSHRLDARAHALRRVQAGLDAAAPPDVRDAPSRRRASASAPRGSTPTVATRACSACRCGRRRSTRTLRGCVETHETEAQARAAEIRLSLQLPASRRCRSSRGQGGGNGLVGDQSLHRRGLRRRRLVRRRPAAAARPRPVDPPPARHAADVRGPPPAGDADAVRRPAGSHADAPRRRRRARSARPQRRCAPPVFSVRPAKSGSASWRYESCFKDYGRCRRRRGSHPGRAPGQRPGPGPPRRLGVAAGATRCRSSLPRRCGPGW